MVRARRRDHLADSTAEARAARPHPPRQALVTLGRPVDGIAELRSAVEVSDAIVNPVGRWQSRASLAGGLRASGDEAAASATATEARRILVAFAATLAPSRAETLLASPRAGEVLEADR